MPVGAEGGFDLVLCLEARLRDPDRDPDGRSISAGFRGSTRLTALAAAPARSGAGRGPTLATSKPFPSVMREGRFGGEELAARSFRVDLEQALEGGARLGAVVVEAGAEEVAIDPDGRYPLASVRKVVTLGGFALAVASGACDSTESVPLAEIERWYWPGTDGGAHQRARDWWAETGILRPG